MSSSMSQAEIDALIASMAAGEPAAPAESPASAGDAAEPAPATLDAEAALPDADLGLSDAPDLGPITQAEVEAAMARMRQAPVLPAPAAAPAAPPLAAAPAAPSGGGSLSQAEIDAMIAGALAEAPAPEAMDSISQSEIDALIALGGDAEPEAPSPAPAAAVPAAPAGSGGGVLSQAEIDAMFAGTSEPAVSAPPAASPAAAPTGSISQAEIDALVALEAAPAPAAPTPAPAAPAPAAVPTPAPAAETPVALPLLQGGNSSILQELTLKLTVELGRTRLPLKELLGMGPGSVITLDRAADEPVDVVIEGRKVMSANVVVIGEMYGFQVKESNIMQKKVG